MKLFTLTSDKLPTESVHYVGVGDYIVRSATGKIYPCKPDIFEQTYEEVE